MYNYQRMDAPQNAEFQVVNPLCMYQFVNDDSVKSH